MLVQEIENHKRPVIYRGKNPEEDSVHHFILDGAHSAVLQDAELPNLVYSVFSYRIN
jgi:hypothetical protein